MSRVQYWLNAIAVHAPKAPIVLVATHLDEKKGKDKEVQETLDNVLQKYKTTFKSLKGSFAVSTLTNKHMDELVNNLYGIALKVLEPYQNKPVNLSFFQLEQFIAVERDFLVKSGTKRKKKKMRQNSRPNPQLINLPRQTSGVDLGTVLRRRQTLLHRPS